MFFSSTLLSLFRLCISSSLPPTSSSLFSTFLWLSSVSILSLGSLSQLSFIVSSLALHHRRHHHHLFSLLDGLCFLLVQQRRERQPLSLVLSLSMLTFTAITIIVVQLMLSASSLILSLRRQHHSPPSTSSHASHLFCFSLPVACFLTIITTSSVTVSHLAIVSLPSSSLSVTLFSSRHLVHFKMSLLSHRQLLCFTVDPARQQRSRYYFLFVLRRAYPIVNVSLSQHRHCR